jgi:hypothetical protein
MTETQPPPPAARLSPSLTPISSRFTELWLKSLLLSCTDADSTVPTAATHAEQVVEVFRQVAVLFSNNDRITVRVLESAPMAPPV